jgi:aminomethyltransferase
MLADLGFMRKFVFTGPDRREFLNGLLTNDIAKLPPLTGLPACLLDAKGRLRALLEVYDLGERFLVLCRPECAENLREGLGKLLILSQTKMEDVSAAWALLYMAGPKAAGVLAGVLGERPEPGPYRVREIAWKGAAIFVISHTRLRPDGALLLAPAALGGPLKQALEQAGVRLDGPEALEVLRVESGQPLFGTDVDTQTLPQEARLDEFLSFTKGCYLGQETISRIHHLGHVNRLLTALKLEGAAVPPRGAAVVHGEEEVGKVTSAVFSPEFRAPLALAMVRRENSAPATRLGVRWEKRSVSAEVVALGRAP